jgi:hypothetical protein
MMHFRLKAKLRTQQELPAPEKEPERNIWKKNPKKKSMKTETTLKTEKYILEFISDILLFFFPPFLRIKKFSLNCVLPLLPVCKLANNHKEIILCVLIEEKQRCLFL